MIHNKTLILGFLIITNSIFSQTFIEQNKLFSSDQAGSDLFGSNLALDGNNLFVGAINTDDNSASNSGSIYRFEFDGSNWAEQEILYASDQAGSDLFGSSLTLDGNNLFVGAINTDDNSASNSGSIYRFEFDGSNWVEQEILYASDQAGSDLFGSSLALDGNNLFVGAINTDDNSASNSGSVYRFVDEETLSTTPIEQNDVINVYPNPTKGIINLRNFYNDSRFTIYNSIGQRLVEDNISSDRKINIENLKNEIYFIRLSDGQLIKIIKE